MPKTSSSPGRKSSEIHGCPGVAIGGDVGELESLAQRRKIRGVPAHFIADAHVDYQITPTVQFFVSASNLLDRRYIGTNSGFEPQKLGPPVQAFLGLRWQLQ